MLVDDCVKKTEMSGVSPSTVPKADMKGKVIVSMSIMGNEGWSFRGYKVMPRYRVCMFVYCLLALFMYLPTLVLPH